MAKTDYTAFRVKLVELLDRRQKALSSDLEVLQSESVARPSDDGGDATSEDVCSELADIESQDISDIVAAIQRIDENSYGNCEDCDKPIPKLRLEALPFVACCVGCQTKREQRRATECD